MADSSDSNNESISNFIKSHLRTTIQPITGLVVDNIESEMKEMSHSLCQGMNKKAAIYAFNILHRLGINWAKFDRQRLKFKPLLDKGKSRSVTNQSLSKNKIVDIIYKVLYELSVVLFYLNEIPHNQSYYLWLCQVVAMNPYADNNQNAMNMARNSTQNYLYGLKCLSTIHTQRLTVHSDHYNTMNPSIVSCKDGYLVNLRAVNYYIRNFNQYISKDKDGIIRTRNYLMALNENYQPLWVRPVVDNSSAERYNTHVRGLEDCRIFWLNSCSVYLQSNKESINSSLTDSSDTSSDSIDLQIDDVIEVSGSAESQISLKYIESNSDQRTLKIDNCDPSESCLAALKSLAVATVTADTRINPNGGILPQVSVGRYSDTLTKNSEIQVVQLIPMFRLDERYRCEKNWVPYQDNSGRFHFIYSHNPLTMIDARPVNKWVNEEKALNVQHACDFSFVKDQPLRLCDHRGSSASIRYRLWRDTKREKEVNLICTHSVIFNKEKCPDDYMTHRRYYYSHLIAYDLNWTLVGVSKPFNLVHKGIEYCAGIVENLAGDGLVFTVGVEDAEAHLAVVSSTVIDSIIKPTKQFLIDVDFPINDDD